MRCAEVVTFPGVIRMNFELCKAVMGLQMISRAMGHHGRGNHPCHLCNDEDGPLQISLLDHILEGTTFGLRDGHGKAGGHAE